ncbi:uncharacterized protein G2W53_040686 [Senna tora]|uniref:Uncharacterized protein n=1 Tax=Senna tora TaxID=362788 RepID=A0A834VYQ5_9FABA|nr:uncharacterized protein G2W53_040686 [Senna tora]
MGEIQVCTRQEKRLREVVFLEGEGNMGKYNVVHSSWTPNMANPKIP